MRAIVLGGFTLRFLWDTFVWMRSFYGDTFSGSVCIFFHSFDNSPTAPEMGRLWTGTWIGGAGGGWDGWEWDVGGVYREGGDFFRERDLKRKKMKGIFKWMIVFIYNFFSSVVSFIVNGGGGGGGLIWFGELGYVFGPCAYMVEGLVFIVLYFLG